MEDRIHSHTKLPPYGVAVFEFNYMKSVAKNLMPADKNAGKR